MANKLIREKKPNPPPLRETTKERPPGNSTPKAAPPATKEKKLTSPPSRRSFAKRSPSTVLASRNLRRKRVGGLLCSPLFLKHVRVGRKPVAKLLDLLQRVWKSEVRKPNSVV